MIKSLFLTSIVGILVVVHPMDSPIHQFCISWYSIDGGGGRCVGDDFQLIGTIGQADAGFALLGDGFSLTGGFHGAIANAVLLGDVNLDGAVNLLDIDPFIDRISTGAFQNEADCNQDGEVNLLDVDTFIAILSGN